MYKYLKTVNNSNITDTTKNGEKSMTVDDRKKNTFINKLLFVFKPKRSTDIVEYADKIIDDYTGLTLLRTRRRDKRLKKAMIAVFSISTVACIGILWCTFKIFF